MLTAVRGGVGQRRVNGRQHDGESADHVALDRSPPDAPTSETLVEIALGGARMIPLSSLRLGECVC